MTTPIGNAALDLLSDAASSTVVDLIVAILVILLLAERELMRAAGHHWRHQAQALGVASVPLLAIFAVVVPARLAALL